MVSGEILRVVDAGGAPRRRPKTSGPTSPISCSASLGRTSLATPPRRRCRSRRRRPRRCVTRTANWVPRAGSHIEPALRRRCCRSGACVPRLRDAVGPGSHLAVVYATQDGSRPRFSKRRNVRAHLYRDRPADPDRRVLGGADRGRSRLVHLPLWRPDSPSDVGEHPELTGAYGGVGRKEIGVGSGRAVGVEASRSRFEVPVQRRKRGSPIDVGCVPPDGLGYEAGRP